MSEWRALTRIATSLALLAAVPVPSGSAQALSPDSNARPTSALDVPYLPQTELLCGGAALAMMERWWGRRGVYAEDFAGLVKPALGGILQSDMDSTARARGWSVRVLRRAPDAIRENLLRGIPAVALIEVAPDRYHYIVVIGWSDKHVVFHDPAGSPFTTMDAARFLAQWNAADGWALEIQPKPEATPDSSASETLPAESPALPCAPWLDLTLDAVAAHRLDEAVGLLSEAQTRCPTEPLVVRELAGVRFKQEHYGEVVRLAAQYVARAPDDSLGWRLLATGRYLTGDREGALDAWNRVGQPAVDLVRVDGTRAIRFREVADAASVKNESILTLSRLALARRRVAEVPALRLSRVDYQAVAGGLVELRVEVLERPRIEPAWRLAAANAIRAVAQDEVGIQVASPLGAGELWTGTWRWVPARPRVSVRLDVPADIGFPGVVGVEGAWEQFRFLLSPAETSEYEESRRSAVLSFGGWVTAGIRPSGTVRVDRWSEDRSYVMASAGVEVRAAANRLSARAAAGYAVPLSSAPGYTSGAVRTSWASSPGLAKRSWSTRLGFDWAGSDAPLGVWPAVGGDLAWAIPLRAHSLAEGGLLAGQSAGQVIAHAGLAADQPVYRLGPLVLALGVFLDGARVMDAADASVGDRFYLDGGAGLRIGIAGGQLGVLRVDVARGLVTDRQAAVTIGVHQGWPP